VLKPLKLTKPIPVKTEVKSQIQHPAENTVNLNNAYSQVQNQIKPLSLKKNKIQNFKQPSLEAQQMANIANRNRENIRLLKSKSIQDIKSPNSVSLFEPESPLDTYKTKLSKCFPKIKSKNYSFSNLNLF